MAGLLDAIKKVTTLKKCGGYLKGKCPFCEEYGSDESFSFAYSPDRDVYYCFTCHRGGARAEDFSPESLAGKSDNTVTWKEIVKEFKVEILRTKKRNNTEELKRLMSAFQVLKDVSHGIMATRDSSESAAECAKEYDNRERINSGVAAWCNKQLLLSEKARNYLIECGLNELEAGALELGYFPGGKVFMDKFLDFMAVIDISKDDLIAEKIILDGRSGLVCSEYEERLIFPVRTKDCPQNVIGLCGITFHKEDERAKSYDNKGFASDIVDRAKVLLSKD